MKYIYIHITSNIGLLQHNIIKNILLYIVIVIGINNLNAQTLPYTFSQSSGTYTAITGGTSFQSGATIATNTISAPITIPFSFTYNGVAYTSLRISNNGFITFGATAPLATTYNPLAAATGYAGAIAGYGFNLVNSAVGGAAPNISYETINTTPNRVFVIQYTDVARTGIAGDRLSFQIRLSETTNAISIIYNNCAATSTTTTASNFGVIGLRGASNTFYSGRQVTATAPYNSWAASGAAADNGATATQTALGVLGGADGANCVRYNNAYLPANGLTYTWTPMATFASLPYTQNFETWTNHFAVNDRPATEIIIHPACGNSSWRNYNEVIANSLWSGTNGRPTLGAGQGTGAASFYNYGAASGRRGYLDIFVNFSSPGTKLLTFDYINPNPSNIRVFLSTDGGLTFGASLLTVATSATWATSTALSLGSSTSANCVVRFDATSTYGTLNSAIDNINIYAPAIPTVSSFTPASGCAGTDSVVIIGTNFSGITGVTIGGTAVTGYLVRTNTEIRARIGTGTTGVIAVTNSAGTGSSAGTFTVNPLPAAIAGGAASVCTGATTPAFTNASSGGTWSITNGTGTASIDAGGVVTGNTVGNVTVVYTLATICFITAPLNVITAPSSLATTPSPTNAATGICYAGSGAVTSVSWTAAAGATGYDVYFGTSASPALVSTNQIGTTYNTGALSANTTYYWRVVPRNNCGFTTGTPVTWTFTTANAPCYCATSPTTVNTIDIITNIVLTNSVSATYSNASTSNGTTNYQIYNNTPLDLYPNTTTNTIAITFGSDGTQHSAAWIDFNNNGVYDASENIGISTVAAGSGATVTYTFTVPAGATLGITRMRIRGGSDAVYTTGGACTASTYGETEDYLVNIVAPCTPPTTQANTVTAPTINQTTATINWTRGNGTAGVIVVAYPGATAGSVPSNGTSYTANTAYGSGSALGTGFVVYNGAGTSVNVTNLAAGTQYTFVVYEYNTTATCYLTTTSASVTFATVCSPPTTQATIGAYTNNTTGTSLTVNWTRGNGTAGVLVVARLTSTAAVDPVNGTNYTANAAFGSGNTTGAGNFVVYKGTGTTVDVTALATLTDYTFTVYEFNTAGNCFMVPGSSSAVTTVCAVPTTQATINAYTNNTTGNSLTVNWTRGNGTAGVIVVGRLTATASFNPTSGTTYSANSVFGAGTGLQTTGTGNFVVYVGTGTTVNVTGLTAGSNYTFTVYEYATVGNCYRIPGSSSTVTPPLPPPANDICAGAIDITCSSSTGNNTYALDETLPGSTCGGTGTTASYKGVWFRVNVPTTGSVTVSTCTGTTWDSYIRAYTGTCAGTLTCLNNTSGIGYSDDGCSSQSSITFTATAGTDYFILLTGYDAADFGAYTITATCPQPPPTNDNCATPTAFPVVPTDGTCSTLSNQSTVYATNSNVTPSGACTFNSGSPDDDVWFSFVATNATTNLNATYVSGLTDVYWQVFSGSCGATMTSILCTDNNAGGTLTGLTIGATYYIRLYTYATSGSTVQTICLNTPPPPPANDNCAAATAFPAVPTDGTCSNLTNQSTASATNSSVTPTGACTSNSGSPDDDVWFRFTATAATTYISATYVSGATDVYWQVFSSACGSSMTSILCTDTDAGGTLSGLTIGNTYYIRLYTWASGNSTVQNICLYTAAPPPPNDECAGATVLTPGAPGVACAPTAGNTLIGYTESPNGCTSGYPDDDIWYEFTATATSHIVTVDGASNFDAVVAVFTDCLASASPDGGDCFLGDDTNSDGIETLTLTGLTVGTRYFVNVYDWWDNSLGFNSGGNFTICVTTPGPPPNNDCAGAISVTPTGPGVPCNPTTGSTNGGTNSGVGCTDGNADDDVWYRFTASANTHVVNVNGDVNFRPVVGVYTTCAATSTVTGGTCFTAASNGSTAALTLTALNIGTTYYVKLYNYNSGAGGFTICVTTPDNACPSGPPLNDEPCNAVDIPIGTIASGNNACATTLNEPAATPGCWSSGNRNTVWFSFIPTSSSVKIRTAPGSLTNTQIAVYSGTCGTGMTQIACNDNAPDCGFTTVFISELNLTGLSTSTRYYVSVDGRLDSVGTFAITVVDGAQPYPTSSGQECGVPVVVCNTQIQVGDPGYQGIGFSCDMTGNNCTTGERGSVWYQINIENPGTLYFDIVPNDYDGISGNETDYDFVLWKIAGSGATSCAAISSSGGSSDVACNYSFLGVTGLSPGGLSPSEYPGFDGAYEAGVTVATGESYLLVVHNFTNSLSGFTLDFKNTTPGIVQTSTPSTVTWTGGSNTVNWNVVNNWGGCTMPNCGIDAIVSPSSTFQPSITAAMGTLTVKNLTINAGATLTLGPNAVIRICENLTNNGTIIAHPTSTILFNDNTNTHTINGTLIGSSSLGNLTITDVAGGTNCTVRANTDIEINGNLTTTDNNSIFDLNGQNLLISGNINNAAGATTILNTAGSTITFDGNGAQTYSPNTTTAIPELELNNVVMNNTSTGVTISTLNTPNMILGSSGTLTLTNGKIITPGNQEVTIKNTANNAVSSGNISSYIEGNLRRYLAAAAMGSFDFPVGNAALGYQLANINFTTAAAAGSIDLLANFKSWGGAFPFPAAPPGWGPECTVYYNQPYLDNGYWSINSTSVSNGLYTATLYNRGFTNAGTASGWSIAKSPSNVESWALDGFCVPTPSPTPVIRTGMQGFSNFSTIQSASPLPVELAEFKVNCTDDIANISWITLSEFNSKEFEIERSVDGVNFIKIGSVNAAGNSNSLKNYSYVDADIQSGQSYYRLKIIDFDGSYKYSIIIELDCKIENNNFVVYFTNELGIVVNSNINISGIYSFEVYDVLGKQIAGEEKRLESGSTLSFIKTNAALPDGVYLIKIKDNNGINLLVKKILIH